MKAFKQNEITIGGYISQVDIKQNNEGEWFGSFNLALEDNYRKNKGKPDETWVDRTHFIEVKVNSYFLGKFNAALNKGDQIVVSGKIVMESWKDKESSANRTAIKIQADKKIAYITKVESDHLKSLNQSQGQQQTPQQQGSFQGQQQAPQQGGFQGQQQAPQQGGFQGQQQGGFQGQQQGGFKP